MNDPWRAIAALLVGVLVLAPVVGTATAGQSAGSAQGLLPPHGTQLEADSRLIDIQLQPDGTAAWTVQYRIELDDSNTTQRFREVKSRINSRPLQYTGPFAETMRGAVSVAARDTGREMAVRNVTVSARELPNNFGVIAYRFEWTGFAEETDDRLTVGDAMVGFFLGSEQSTLIIGWPAEFTVEEVTPDPDEQRENAAVWEGPKEFGAGKPRVVVVGGGSPLPVPPVTALAVVALVAVSGVASLRYLLGRWRGGNERPESPVATTDGATGDADPDGATAEGPAEPPEELLSDEERVLRLLEDNGGRLKQQDVVERMEWSETKTSKVVSDLREAEKIEVYRLGRENVLSLPGEMDV